MEETKKLLHALSLQQNNTQPLSVSPRKSKQSNTAKEEETLLKIAIDEYNDLFPKILLITQKEFIPSLIKMIEIAMTPSTNNFSEDCMVKVVSIIQSQYYEPEYFKVHKLIKSITNLKLYEKLESNYIPHCNKTKEAIHTCGEKLYNISPYLLCLKCKMIYHPSCVLLYCNQCKADYYSSVNSDNDKEQYKPATWIKYHCNVVINDTMKCFKCQSVLYLNKKTNKLCCLKCNFEIDQLGIQWTCVICKKEFTCEAKEYNPLEFKIMKMTVKQTLFNEIEAKPETVPCCNIPQDEIKKYTFHHKKNCDGIIYQGTLNGKKIVVCSQCRLLYNYDTHLWLCPICKHRFKSDEQPQQDYPKSANRNASRDEMKDVIRAFKSESGNKTDRPNPTRNDLGKINRVITYGKEVSDFLSKDNKEAKMEISPSRPRINSNKEDLRKDLHINLSNKNIQEQKVPFPKKEKLDTFNCEDYTITRQIGQGTFGKIYEVVDKKNKTFAMKKILTNSMEEINAITNEYMMLKSLSSYKLNLVNIYAIQIKQLDKTTQAMYILMDLAVRDWEKEIEIRGIKKHFYSESELIKILKELTHTFAELQRHNISHRDIKPQNILLLQDKSFRIADFGEAKRVIQSNKRTVRQTIRGTELYMSPILFHALKEKGKTDYYTVHNTFKSDVFSLGLCFLLAASLTFNSLISIRELEDMLSIKVRLAGYLQRYSTKFTDVLYNMIELDEKLRFDFVELEKYVENL